MSVITPLLSAVRDHPCRRHPHTYPVTVTRTRAADRLSFSESMAFSKAAAAVRAPAEERINAAITGVKHQRCLLRENEREFPCAQEHAALLLCTGFLAVIVQAGLEAFIIYILSPSSLLCGTRDWLARRACED